MADPLTITTGVLGLLSALSKLSVQIIDFRKDFKDATTEIGQLTGEVNDLTGILHRLEEMRTSEGLPSDLIGVLENLNRAVLELELYLRRAQSKKFRSAYWALTGKKECTTLCRGLESYKSTLNITLTFLNIISGHELQDKADQILSGINDVKIKLNPTKDNFILQKYLESVAESVIEGTTTGTIAEAEFHNPFQSNSIQKPKNNEQAIPETSAELWKDINKSPKYTIKLPDDVNFETFLEDEPLLTSHGEQVVICLPPRGGIQSYGTLYFGTLSSGFTKQKEDLYLSIYQPPGDGTWSYRVNSIQFRQDGRFFAALRCIHITGSIITPDSFLVQNFILSWTSGRITSRTAEIVSPIFDCRNSSMLSKDARYFAYINRYQGLVTVFDIEKKKIVLCIPPANERKEGEVRRITFSENCSKILVSDLLPVYGYLCTIWEVTSGTQLYRIESQQMLPQSLNWDRWSILWAFDDFSKELVIATLPPYPSPSDGKDYFVRIANLKLDSMPITHFDVKGFFCKAGQWLSSDGSCALVSQNTLIQTIMILDVRSGRPITQIDKNAPVLITFNNDDRRIMVIEEVQKHPDWQYVCEYYLNVWELPG